MKRYTKSELRLLLACFWAYTAAYISRCNLSPSLAAIAASFGVSAARAGLLPTCFAIPYAVGQIVSGLLADRYPAVRLMLIGLLGSSAVNVLFSICPYFPLLVALWFVNGLLQSMVWTPIMRILAVQFRDSVRDHAVFFISLTLIFGYLLAWALSGLLTSLFGWRAAFLVSGTVTAAIAVPSVLRMKGLPAGGPSLPGEPPKARAPIRKLLLGTNLILLLICCFTNGYVRDSISYWATKLLMDTQGIDLNSAVGIILIIPCVNFLGIQMGRAAYQRTGNNLYLSSGILFAVCTVLCAALGPVSQSSLPGCIAVLVLISAMTYGLNPLLTTLMPMLYCHMNRVALAAGLLDAMIYAGSAFSGFFAGYLCDRFGWSAVFLSWAALSLIGTLTLEAARRAGKRGA
ncbi:MAG: MFS transporter [Clostridia bacterium]|nr:MFS transporter [Clostridia bacterium]